MNQNIEVLTSGKGTPHIAFVTGIHGDEQIFSELKEIFDDIKLKRGAVSLIFAHPDAAKSRKRFIETDLNRSFPGKRSGSIEQKLAYALTSSFKGVDCLIDFHSFHFNSPAFTVLTNQRDEVIKLASIVGLKENVIIPGRGVSFVEHVRLGIGVELGLTGDASRKKRAKKVINNVLSYYKMIPDKSSTTQARFYKAEEKTIVPLSFKVSPHINNFKFVKKGTLLGEHNGKNTYAANSFYPVLLNTKGYGKVLCRNGKKLSNTI